MKYRFPQVTYFHTENVIFLSSIELDIEIENLRIEVYGINMTTRLYSMS